LRLYAGQRDGIERGRIAAGGCPDIGQNFSGTLHDAHSSLTFKAVTLKGLMFKALGACSVLTESEPGSRFCFDAFSSREPIPILLENAIAWKELQWHPSIH
jgi:hypothetical protein